jgi:hypothetical protein
MRARDNPFATAWVHRIRYRPRGVTWDDLLERLARMNYRGAIVGPEGAGKTTLLEDLEPRLRARGFAIVWLRLSREAPRISPEVWGGVSGNLSPRHVILFDGAEQLSRWAWWCLLHRSRFAGGIIITSHRPGLLPTLLHSETTPELLAQIISELLGQTSPLELNEIVRLHRRHRGNLREALRELYDQFAGQLDLSKANTH